MTTVTAIKNKILVVDDVQKNLEIAVRYLIDANFEVFIAKSGEDALEKVKTVNPEIILLDVMLPGISGFEMCKRIKEADSTKEIPVIFMTSLADLSDKVKGFEVGGVDYITKPIQREELLARVTTHLRLRIIQKELMDANANLEHRVAERTAELNRALEKVEKLKNQFQAQSIYLREEIKSEHNFNEIIGRSAPLKKVLMRIEQVAKTEASVLILGETGTGKELIARAIHNGSSRNNNPLVKVNCAAMPANLIESELFGHEKGAFTGAVSKKVGRFELADGGTIFLDEIGDLPMELQPKLLRALQEGEIERLGNSQPISVDVRIIAATNRDLKQAIENTQFREDLFFRLNVFPVHLPPLRQRQEDIPILTEHFVCKVSNKLGKPINGISDTVFDQLKSYPWPGNIRELQNLVERAVILASGTTLQIDHFEFTHNHGFEPESSESGSSNIEENSSGSLENIERAHILKTLQRCFWKIKGSDGAAAALNINPSTLRFRMNKLGIKKP